MHVQLRVGSTAGKEAPAATGLDLKALEKIVKNSELDYTLLSGKGCFNGEPENSSIIDLFHFISPYDDPQKLYMFSGKIQSLLETIYRSFGQDSVLTTCSVSSKGTDTRWTRLLEKGNPALRYPAVILRKCHDRDSLFNSMSNLYGEIVQHFKVILPGASYFDGIPAAYLLAPKKAELKLTQDEQKDGSNQRIIDWDVYSLKKLENAQLFQPSCWQDYSRNAEFLALFQRVGESPVFATSLNEAFVLPSENDTPSIKPLTVRNIPYKVGNGFSEVQCLETLDYWFLNGLDSDKMKSFLGKKRNRASLIKSSWTTTVIRALIISPDNEILIRERAGNVGQYPKAIEVVPAGMLETVPGVQRPSLFANFVRELDEELFGGAETDRDFQSLLGCDHVKCLEGTLTLKALVLDLLRYELNFVVTFSPSKRWWNANRPKMRLNWEYVSRSPKLKALSEFTDYDSTAFKDHTPAGAVLICLAASDRKDKKVLAESASNNRLETDVKSGQ